MAEKLRLKKRRPKRGAVPKTGFQLAQVIHPRERAMLAQALGWGLGPLVVALFLSAILPWRDQLLVFVGGWIVLAAGSYLLAPEIAERKMLASGEPGEARRLQQMANMQARAIGIEPPTIVVSELAPHVMVVGRQIALPADLVKELSDGEQWALLAHELAHLRAGHTFLLNLMRRSRHSSGIMKVPGAPVQVLTRGLALWEPYADFSADRIALALTRDHTTLGQTLLKQAAFHEPGTEISSEEIVDYLSRPGALQADGAEVTAHYKLGELLRTQRDLHDRLRQMAAYAGSDGYKQAVDRIEESYAKAKAGEKPPKAEQPGPPPTDSK